MADSQTASGYRPQGDGGPYGQPPNQGSGARHTSYALACAKQDGIGMFSDFLHYLSCAHEREYGTTAVSAALRFAANMGDRMFVGMSDQEVMNFANGIAKGLPAR